MLTSRCTSLQRHHSTLAAACRHLTSPHLTRTTTHSHSTVDSLCPINSRCQVVCTQADCKHSLCVSAQYPKRKCLGPHPASRPQHQKPQHSLNKALTQHSLTPATQDPNCTQLWRVHPVESTTAAACCQRHNSTNGISTNTYGTWIDQHHTQTMAASQASLGEGLLRQQTSARNVVVC